MITFHPTEGKHIATVVGKTKTPLFWYPYKEESKQIKVQDYSDFNTQEMRDSFMLSKDQATQIMNHLSQDTEPEDALQSKFFAVKRVLKETLYYELDLRDDSERIILELPKKNDVFAGHEAIVGSTNSGKTWYVLQQLIRNITGPKGSRRQWIWISSEFKRDKTLASVREKLRFQKYVQGVDVSEKSFEESEHQTREEFFEHEIKRHVDYAVPGTIVVTDDFQDSCCATEMRRWINTALRVARHNEVSFKVIFHNIRAGSFSSQAHNSVKYFTVFPRAQRGKIVQYLNQDHAIPLKRARELVENFATQKKGRHMSIHLHSPNFISGPDLLTLF